MYKGVFNRSYVNIYEKICEEKYDNDGKIKSSVSDEGLYGQRFEVLDVCTAKNVCGCEDRDRFIKIKTRYGYTGYVRCKEVIVGDECEDAPDTGCGVKSVQVKSAFADILSEPSVSAIRFMTVTRGAVLMCFDEIYGAESSGYAGVRLYDGRVGYIKKSYIEAYVFSSGSRKISELDEENFRKKLVRTALSYLGTQYRWGGKTPLGIDCSGLASMSYMLNGVYIYRDAKLMPGFPVHEIPYECIREGDLLYFPGHIAMYIGNREYIHSTARPGSDGVVINSLDSGSENYREDLAHGIYAAGSIF